MYPRGAMALRFALLALLALGCSATGGTGGSGGGAAGGGGGEGGSAGGAGGAGTGGAGGGDGGLAFGGQAGQGGSGAGPNEIAEVFGHGPDVLYRLDPNTKQVTTVGPFQGCSSVIDIALDKDGNMFGTTFGALYKIDKATAVCTHVSNGSYPNSLSFVPAGTVDPNAEALVGYVDSTYVRIDTTTGNVTTLGSIGGGLSSSGDIVSVKNGKTLLTVTGAGCSTDCLIEVDPATGALVQNWGPTGYGAVFGLAFWAGKAYAFDSWGDLAEIAFVNGQLVVTAIPIPNAPADLGFWGAGSTTSAPPEPPPA